MDFVRTPAALGGGSKFGVSTGTLFDSKNNNAKLISDISNFDTGIRYLFITGITGYTVFSVITEISCLGNYQKYHILLQIC